ncbi:hypothetical protein FKM82_016515 [Ascaphus truei]
MYIKKAHCIFPARKSVPQIRMERRKTTYCTHSQISCYIRSNSDKRARTPGIHTVSCYKKAFHALRTDPHLSFGTGERICFSFPDPGAI